MDKVDRHTLTGIVPMPQFPSAFSSKPDCQDLSLAPTEVPLRNSRRQTIEHPLHRHPAKDFSEEDRVANEQIYQFCHRLIASLYQKFCSYSHCLPKISAICLNRATLGREKSCREKKSVAEQPEKFSGARKNRRSRKPLNCRRIRQRRLKCSKTSSDPIGTVCVSSPCFSVGETIH